MSESVRKRRVFADEFKREAVRLAEDRAGWCSRVNLHYGGKSCFCDLWYSGGGAFQDQPSFGYAGRPSGGSTNLATMLDASIDYALNKSTSVTLYGAYEQGGGAVRASFPGRDAAFGYLELNHRW